MGSQSQALAVEIESAAVTLEAELVPPPEMAGLVVIADDSSSRKSAGNQLVAQRLQAAGLGTVLLHLLTPEEARRDESDTSLDSDVGLLAARLIGVIDWLAQQAALDQSAFGLFGEGATAAACLVAAQQRPGRVAAIVSCGGRPDLAADAALDIGAPTLLIVGGRDRAVLEMNRDTLRRLSSASRLEPIDGATHPFEEAGASERVGLLAVDWFRGNLPPVLQAGRLDERRLQAHEDERAARRDYRHEFRAGSRRPPPPSGSIDPR